MYLKKYEKSTYVTDKNFHKCLIWFNVGFQSSHYVMFYPTCNQWPEGKTVIQLTNIYDLCFLYC